MSKTKQNLRRSLGPIAGLCVATTLLLNSNQASATQSPAGCTANNLSVNIAKNKNNIKNGDTVVFTITVVNPNTADTCDLTLGPAGLVLNSDNSLLFVANGGFASTSTVSVYRVFSNGAIVSVNGSPFFTGSIGNPTAIGLIEFPTS